MCGVQVDSWSNETPYEQQPQQQLVGPSKLQQKYWSWLLLKCKVQHNCLAGWPQCLASGIVFKCWSASELVVWQPDNVQLSESHSPTVIDPCVSTHCTLWGSAPGFDSVIKSLSLILTVHSDCFAVQYSQQSDISTLAAFKVSKETKISSYWFSSL